MSVFDIPQSLLEAINQVTNPTSWRRDLDIRPLVMIAGLSKHRIVNEVYSGKASDFATDETEAQKIHDALTIPTPKNSRVAYSLSHYSGSGYDHINSSLWHNYLHGSEVPNDVKSHTDNIKSVLLPETKINNLKLYTGVKVSPAATAGVEWNSTRPVKILHLPAFTSTSTNFDVAEQFTEPDMESVHHESDHHGVIEPGATHILQLNFPNTIHHAASMMDHGVGHEEEVLLGPNHRFELHPRPTKIDRSHGPVYVWKATSIGVNNELMFKQRDFTKHS